MHGSGHASEGEKRKQVVNAVEHAVDRHGRSKLRRHLRGQVHQRRALSQQHHRHEEAEPQTVHVVKELNHGLRHGSLREVLLELFHQHRPPRKPQVAKLHGAKRRQRESHVVSGREGDANDDEEQASQGFGRFALAKQEEGEHHGGDGLGGLDGFHEGGRG